MGFTYAAKMRAILAEFTHFFIAGGQQDHKVMLKNLLG